MEYYSALKRNELSSHEKTQRNLKCILLSEKIQSEKARLNEFYDSNYMTFWKRQNYGDNIKIRGCQGLVGGWMGEHRGFLVQWNYFVWYYNGGYMSFLICLNPLNIQHQQRTLMQTMGLRWLWCISLGSSVVTNVPLWWGMLIKGEAVHVGAGGGDYKGILLCFPLNFALK